MPLTFPNYRQQPPCFAGLSVASRRWGPGGLGEKNRRPTSQYSVQTCAMETVGRTIFLSTVAAENRSEPLSDPQKGNDSARFSWLFQFQTDCFGSLTYFWLVTHTHNTSVTQLPNILSYLCHDWTDPSAPILTYLRNDIVICIISNILGFRDLQCNYDPGQEVAHRVRGGPTWWRGFPFRGDPVMTYTDGDVPRYSSSSSP